MKILWLSLVTTSSLCIWSHLPPVVSFQQANQNHGMICNRCQRRKLLRKQEVVMLPQNKRNDYLLKSKKSKRVFLAVASSQDQSSKDSCTTKNYLTDVLKRYKYDDRLVTINTKELPVVAEIYDKGQWELCLIIEFQKPSTSTKTTDNTITPPLAKIQIIDSGDCDENKPKDERIIDLGQITTIWKNVPTVKGSTNEERSFEIRQLFNSWRRDVEQKVNEFPVNFNDQTMQRLYGNLANSRGRSISPKTSLSKKEISRIVERCDDDMSSKKHIDTVLRRLIKTGPRMSKLADSKLATEYLFQDNKPSTAVDAYRRQIVGAEILSQDAKAGGRFKRMTCIFISTEFNSEEDNEPRSVTLINGGWLAVEGSVRAGTEARKFVERINGNPNIGIETDEKKSDLTRKVKTLTASDERIAQRLECLAMGELFAWDDSKLTTSSKRSKKEQAERNAKNLEVDVRETLKAMHLPPTPDGAQDALLRMGRWTKKPKQVRFEPWSELVLDASKTYVDMNSKRQNELLEDRVDLTALPCICVDAKSTTFRDDAISVRPRSITGRTVVPDASKWELLIHITDVSDLYSPMITPAYNRSDAKNCLRVLRESAANRGTSRYDLPLGPLHLLPPVVLESLSLQTLKIDMTSKNKEVNSKYIGQGNDTLNRCVTLWAYIDERNGQVLDAGVERTVISRPIALSYASASALLEGRLPAEDSRNEQLNKARSILAIAERNLLLWSTQQRQRDKNAQKREMRLSARELVAREISSSSDDGREGFQRTRGHKVVDAALDLYGFAIRSLLSRQNKPIPTASSNKESRGGRTATAPLRRYIDGVAQRQLLSVLCKYGGPPLSKKECIEINRVVDRASNALLNDRSTKKSVRKQQGIHNNNHLTSKRLQQQKNAVRELQVDLVNRKNRCIPALSTGNKNEVTILGNGAIAKCQGVDGTLKPGERVIVEVKNLDIEKGHLRVSFVQKAKV